MHILFCFYTPTEALTSQKVQIPYRGISGLRGKYHQRGIAGGIGGNANREVFLGALGEIPTERYPWGHWGKYQQRGIPEGIGGNTNRGVSPGALGEIPTDEYPLGHWGKFQQKGIPEARGRKF